MGGDNGSAPAAVDAGRGIGESVVVPMARPQPAAVARPAEAMWLVVTRFDGPHIHGVLQSEPAATPGLKAGSAVTIDAAAILDYAIFDFRMNVLEGGTSDEVKRQILEGE